jgi:hypothetical protein
MCGRSVCDELSGFRSPVGLARVEMGSHVRLRHAARAALWKGGRRTLCRHEPEAGPRPTARGPRRWDSFLRLRGIPLVQQCAELIAHRAPLGYEVWDHLVVGRRDGTGQAVNGGLEGGHPAVRIAQ